MCRWIMHGCECTGMCRMLSRTALFLTDADNSICFSLAFFFPKKNSWSSAPFMNGKRRGISPTSYKPALVYPISRVSNSPADETRCASTVSCDAIVPTETYPKQFSAGFPLVSGFFFCAPHLQSVARAAGRKLADDYLSVAVRHGAGKRR